MKDRDPNTLIWPRRGWNSNMTAWENKDFYDWDDIYNFPIEFEVAMTWEYIK